MGKDAQVLIVLIMSEDLIVFTPSTVRHRQLSKFQVSWKTRCYLLVNLLKVEGTASSSQNVLTEVRTNVQRQCRLKLIFISRRSV